MNYLAILTLLPGLIGGIIYATMKNRLKAFKFSCSFCVFGIVIFSIYGFMQPVHSHADFGIFNLGSSAFCATLNSP